MNRRIGKVASQGRLTAAGRTPPRRSSRCLLTAATALLLTSVGMTDASAADKVTVGGPYTCVDGWCYDTSNSGGGHPDTGSGNGTSNGGTTGAGVVPNGSGGGAPGNAPDGGTPTGGQACGQPSGGTPTETPPMCPIGPPYDIPPISPSTWPWNAACNIIVDVMCRLPKPGPVRGTTCKFVGHLACTKAFPPERLAQ
jgi:hypothetical protein